MIHEYPLLVRTGLTQMTIRTDDMDLAGDIVQALATFLNMDDLQTYADFPDDMETLRQVLIKVGVTL